MITAITHITLFTHDQDATLKFYTEKLGFKKHTDEQFGPLRWLTITAADQPHLEIAIMRAESAEEKALVGNQADTKPLLCLATTDCRGDYTQLKAAGVEFVDTPAEQPWGIAVTLKDPSGNHIYLCQGA